MRYGPILETGGFRNQQPVTAKGPNFIKLVCGVHPGLQPPDQAMDHLLHFDQIASQDLFPDNRLFLQPVRQDIIDILYIDQIALEVIEIFQEGPVTTRSEKKLSGSFPEGSILQVNGQGIGRMPLKRERDIQTALVLLFIPGSYLYEKSLDRSFMFRCHRHMKTTLPLTITKGIISLNQVFFKSRTVLDRINMKFM